MQNTASSGSLTLARPKSWIITPHALRCCADHPASILTFTGHSGRLREDSASFLGTTINNVDVVVERVLEALREEELACISAYPRACARTCGVPVLGHHRVHIMAVLPRAAPSFVVQHQPCGTPVVVDCRKACITRIVGQFGLPLAKSKSD